MPKDFAGVMHEYKHNQLHSGSKDGPIVTDPQQAKAIAISEQKKNGKSKTPPSIHSLLSKMAAKR